MLLNILHSFLFPLNYSFSIRVNSCLFMVSINTLKIKDESELMETILPHPVGNVRVIQS